MFDKISGLFGKLRCDRLPKSVDIPVELYKSLRGEYFVGYADELTFGKGTSAGASLKQPWWLKKTGNLFSRPVVHS